MCSLMSLVDALDHFTVRTGPYVFTADLESQ